MTLELTTGTTPRDRRDHDAQAYVRELVQDTETTMKQRKMYALSPGQWNFLRSSAEQEILDRVERGLVTQIAEEYNLPRDLLQALIYNSSIERDMVTCYLGTGKEQKFLLHNLVDAYNAACRDHITETQLTAALNTLTSVDKTDKSDLHRYAVTRMAGEQDKRVAVLQNDVRSVLAQRVTPIDVRYVVSTQGVTKPHLLYDTMRMIGERAKKRKIPFAQEPELIFSKAYEEKLEEAYDAAEGQVSRPVLVGLNRTCDSWNPELQEFIVSGCFKQHVCKIPAQVMAQMVNCKPEQLEAIVQTDLIPASRNLARDVRPAKESRFI